MTGHPQLSSQCPTLLRKSSEHQYNAVKGFGVAPRLVEDIQERVSDGITEVEEAQKEGLGAHRLAVLVQSHREKKASHKTCRYRLIEFIVDL